LRSIAYYVTVDDLKEFLGKLKRHDLYSGEVNQRLKDHFLIVIETQMMRRFIELLILQNHLMDWSFLFRQWMQRGMLRLIGHNIPSNQMRYPVEQTPNQSKTTFIIAAQCYEVAPRRSRDVVLQMVCAQFCLILW
jgi:hypothetical protein